MRAVAILRAVPCGLMLRISPLGQWIHTTPPIQHDDPRPTRRSPWVLSTPDRFTKKRVDKFLRVWFPQARQGPLARLLRKGLILVQREATTTPQRVPCNYRLNSGDHVLLRACMDVLGPIVDPSDDGKAIDEGDTSMRPSIPQTQIQDVRRRVLYEDEWLIAINKPPGLAAQGGSKVFMSADVLMNAAFPSEQGGAFASPRLVHRLDKDVSGVLLFGRTREVTSELVGLFQRADGIHKTYWACVCGSPEPSDGWIRLPLRKGLEGGVERVIGTLNPCNDVKDSATQYHVVERANGGEISWLILHPLTGRKHQLRVHCASGLHTPILGDTKYGSRGSPQCLEKPVLLHLLCREIRLTHPITHKELVITAPLPDHMARTWAALGWSTEAG